MGRRDEDEGQRGTKMVEATLTNEKRSKKWGWTVVSLNTCVGFRNYSMHHPTQRLCRN